MAFRAPAGDALIAVELDAFVALFHRPSGITHLLASPAPEILAALAQPRDLDGLLAILSSSYDLVDPDRAALTARLEELIASGLVERA